MATRLGGNSVVMWWADPAAQARPSLTAGCDECALTYISRFSLNLLSYSRIEIMAGAKRPRENDNLGAGRSVAITSESVLSACI